MFEVMRRNMKLIMWFTAGAFVLLIFLAWGAEYQLGKSGKRTAGVIGRVNGLPIHAILYQQRIAEAREGYRQRGQNLDEATEVQLRLQAWDALIQEILVAQEIRRLGIRVTDREIVEAIKNQPLPEITRSPEFQTDGRFDYSKYLSALGDPTRNWIQLERIYREDLPKQKLQQLVLSSVKVSAAEVRRQFDRDNSRAKVAYAFVPATRFPIDSGSLEETAIRGYYDANKEEYATDAQAWVEYIRIEKRATVTDTLNARELIEQAAKEAGEGEDFAILVSAYSEAPVQLQGGATGTYMTREQFSAPQVREAAFSLGVGEVSGILTESNGYHLIKVEDRRTTDEKEEAKIADIFVPITLSAETLTEVYDRTVTLANTSRDYGGDLAAAAADHPGTEATTAGPFGRSGYVPALGRLGQISGFRDWAFNATAGSVRTLDGPEAMYVVHLVKRRPGGVAPFEEVRERARNDYANSLQAEQAKERAEKILLQVREGGSLEDAARSDSTATFDTTDEFARSGFARGLGNDPAVLSRIFHDPVGLVPDVISTIRGAYVIDILSRLEPDTALFEAQKETIRRQLTQRRQSEVMGRWMEDIRMQAEIEDYRGETEI